MAAGFLGTGGTGIVSVSPVCSGRAQRSLARLSSKANKPYLYAMSSTVSPANTRCFVGRVGWPFGLASKTSSLCCTGCRSRRRWCGGRGLWLRWGRGCGGFRGWDFELLAGLDRAAAAVEPAQLLCGDAVVPRDLLEALAGNDYMFLWGRCSGLLPCLRGGLRLLNHDK